MALRSQAIALNTSTATPLLVKGTSSGQFPNISGTVNDPLPVIIQNNNASISITVGGPNVASEGGVVIPAGSSLQLSLIGSPVSDIPYAVSASATPNATVICGRQ